MNRWGNEEMAQVSVPATMALRIKMRADPVRFALLDEIYNSLHYPYMDVNTSDRMPRQGHLLPALGEWQT